MGKMKLLITTLSENAAVGAGILGEWGLSVLVETGEATGLLDAGQSISAAHNAARLGIDLSRIDRIVLSHGHYDHTGGLRRILTRMQKEVEVIAHPDVWAAKYRCRPDGERRYIGIPFSQRSLEKSGARFNLTNRPVKITDNILSTGEIPITTDYEDMEPQLYVEVNGELVPDDLLDDQAMVITTRHGLVVVLGCAHRGIINTLHHARRLTGIEQIYAVLGGSHLMNAPEERGYLTLSALREFGVRRLSLCHCTGDRAAAIFAQEFGVDYVYNHAGTRFEIDE